MSEKPRMRVRLYRDWGDEYDDLGEDYDVAHFCDMVPVVGDLIATSWLKHKQADPSFYSDRIVYEVVARYFVLTVDGKGLEYVALVVRQRPGEKHEQQIVAKG